jgi:hypothetical protein
MSQPVQPETPIQRSLREMRATIKRLESLGNATVNRLALELRHHMIDLTARVNEMAVNAAARRMTGDADPLKPQAAIEETPLFSRVAMIAPPSAEELARIDQAHWREGDHTQDREGNDE